MVQMIAGDGIILGKKDPVCDQAKVGRQIGKVRQSILSTNVLMATRFQDLGICTC